MSVKVSPVKSTEDGATTLACDILQTFGQDSQLPHTSFDALCQLISICLPFNILLVLIMADQHFWISLMRSMILDSMHSILPLGPLITVCLRCG